MDVPINISNDFNEMKNRVELEKDMKSIDDYKNNFELKVSLVNIDSRYRTKVPMNIIKMTTILPNNPIQTTINSKEIKLHVPNHSIKIGDQIILQNVKSTKSILNNPIYLLSNFNYFIVHMENHNILLDYTTTDNFNIFISAYEPLTNADRLIGNIPINSIIGIQTIYIYDPANLNSFLSNNLLNTILSILNITTTQLQENYFFVALPFKYINSLSINNVLYNIPKIFTFDFMNIGGISLSYMNANYPINYLQYQSSHEITNTELDYVYFNSSVNAIYSHTSGGNIIDFGLIINTLEGYPNANEYTIELKKSFTDIVRIELVTTEIPFIDFNIKNNINIQNNKLYWQYLEDGNHVYSISISEGSYDTNSLLTIVQSSMNAVPRISSTSKDIINNLFEVKFNQNSQEVQFIAFKFELLPNSLSLQLDSSLGNDVVKLVITHPNNFININDTIIISGSKKIGDVNSSLINTSHIVYSIDKDTSTYTTLITLDQTYTNINLSGTGGPNIHIRTPTNASFLFNYPDTLGNILGFKNSGSMNAITPFSHIVSNFNDYVLVTPFNDVGNTNTSKNMLNLTGDFYYMLLYLNDFEGIQTNLNTDNAFSKILMIGNSGDVMFNTFLNAPLEFDIPISMINEFKIRFLFPDGSKPDFRNFDHSFTLRIIERNYKITNTGLNSRKINYIDSLKQFTR